MGHVSTLPVQPFRKAWLLIHMMVNLKIQLRAPPVVCRQGRNPRILARTKQGQEGNKESTAILLLHIAAHQLIYRSQDSRVLALPTRLVHKLPHPPLRIIQPLPPLRNPIRLPQTPRPHPGRRRRRPHHPHHGTRPRRRRRPSRRIRRRMACRRRHPRHRTLNQTTNHSRRESSRYVFYFLTPLR